MWKKTCWIIRFVLNWLNRLVVQLQGRIDTTNYGHDFSETFVRGHLGRLPAKKEMSAWYRPVTDVLLGTMDIEVFKTFLWNSATWFGNYNWRTFGCQNVKNLTNLTKTTYFIEQKYMLDEKLKKTGGNIDIGENEQFQRICFLKSTVRRSLHVLLSIIISFLWKGAKLPSMVVLMWLWVLFLSDTKKAFFQRNDVRASQHTVNICRDFQISCRAINLFSAQLPISLFHFWQNEPRQLLNIAVLALKR